MAARARRIPSRSLPSTFSAVHRHGFDEPRHTFRLGRSSKNAIGCHAGSSNRLRDAPRHRNLCSLCHSVMHHFSRNLHRRFAGNKEDAAPVLLQHSGKIMSREPHSAHYVDLKQTVPVLVRNLGEWLRLENSYIVHQHVDQGSFAITASAPAGPEKSATMPSTLVPCSLAIGLPPLLHPRALRASVHVNMRAFYRK
jgi:hypothetical protein